MNEAKHTPGPWTQGYKGKFQRHNASNIYDVNGNCIASVTGIPLHTSVEDLERSRNQSDAEGMANARLIAAAPELLEACKLLLMAIREHSEDSEEVSQRIASCPAFLTALNAITKAEGSAL